MRPGHVSYLQVIDRLIIVYQLLTGLVYCLTLFKYSKKYKNGFFSKRSKNQST